jgi:hypothetical protein
MASRPAQVSFETLWAREHRFVTVLLSALVTVAGLTMDWTAGSTAGPFWVPRLAA